MTTEEKVKDLWDKWYSGDIPYTEYNKQLMEIIEYEKRIAYKKGYVEFLSNRITEQTKYAR